MRTEFAGALTAADCKRHIPHTFTLGEGCTGLRIEFRYSPPRVDAIRNMLTLTLFDPHGFRGAGHRHGDLHVIELGRDRATPGYHAGPLTPGEWTVQIDSHMILPGPDCEYTLRVEACAGEAAANGAELQPRQAPQFDFVANPAAGWYRGDLHAHTLHSDAAWDAQALAAAARRLGLDFVTLTDHNTTTPLAEFAHLAGPGFLTMGGMELTTFWGHAVCLGAREWVDWRVDAAGEAMNRIAQEQTAAGNLFVIAHPQDEGDPWCTGCRWVYPKMRPGAARFVEVWNGRWESTDPTTKNEGSLGLWYDWLNRGLRMVATAGSDAHGPNHLGPGVGFNVVYAHELSQAGILDGLRRGQSYLSAGCSLRVAAFDGAGRRAEIGGTLAGQGAALVHVEWEDAPPGASLRLVRNGRVVQAATVPAQGHVRWRVDGAPGRWIVLELRQAGGLLGGLTNPIWFE